MPWDLGLFNALFSHAGRYGRSTALGTIQWLVFILGMTLVALVWAKAHGALIGLVGVLLVLACGLYGYAYIYFLHGGNVEALRSERYSIRRMEIDKGLIGDNTAGLTDPQAAG